MLTILFLTLAAIFKAVADTLADHFDVSVFRKRERRFWDKNISWQYAKKIGGYKIDGWHIANSLMIVSFIGLCFSHTTHFYWYFIYGVLFVVVFNLFYNKILR